MRRREVSNDPTPKRFFAGWGIAVVMCAALTAGSALAQSTSEKKTAKPSKPAQAKPMKRKTPPSTAPTRRAVPATKGKVPASPGKAKRGRSSGGSGLLPVEPNARWSCANTTVTLPPVWRGKKALTFAFDIRNTGTAPLRYKAHGG